MQELRALKIDGDDPDFLTVGLAEILNCVEDVAEIHWSILWIEGRGALQSGTTIVDFEKLINNAESGTLVSYEELERLSNDLNQIIDLILIGDPDSRNLKRYENEWEMCSNCRYTIQLIDSSYWIVCSKNNIALENISRSLEGVKYIDVNTLRLSDE